jgi:CheY-like chemotaxis protein
VVSNASPGERRMTGGRRSGPARAVPVLSILGGAATERRRVLVVEDDPPLREFLTELLGQEGYAVTATDAVIGVRALVEGVQPHAILLDLGLPYRSGASLLVELKADPRTAPIPVIVVSGMPDLLAGERRTLAAAVIPKPFGTEALLEALRRALQADVEH